MMCKMSLTSDKKVHFTPEQMDAIQEAFSHFDVNNDGLISLPEFKAIMTALDDDGASDRESRVSDEEIKARMDDWDTNGDGCVNFTEFVDAMIKILTDTDNEARLKDAFRLFDTVRLQLFFSIRIPVKN